MRFIHIKLLNFCKIKAIYWKGWSLVKKLRFVIDGRKIKVCITLSKVLPEIL